MPRTIIIPNWRGDPLPACPICRSDPHGDGRPFTEAADCYIWRRQELIGELKRLRSWGRAINGTRASTPGHRNTWLGWSHANLLLHQRDAARAVFNGTWKSYTDDACEQDYESVYLRYSGWG